jgi:hypothetical protein
MTLIQTILNEQHAAAATRQAIHAAKVAAGGRITRHNSDGYADEWTGLPANFSEIVKGVIIDSCARFGVEPEAIGYFPEGR